MQIPNQKIVLPVVEKHRVSLYIKREDLHHHMVSGNKYRKLKYNILEAKRQGQSTLLTFGGAYSNHIAATAYAGNKADLGTIGVIRGEELKKNWQKNPTLNLANAHGMQFHFISRHEYRHKKTHDFQRKLKECFGTFYQLPEGGTNALAVKGCEEILTKADSQFDYICCCTGTGGTIAGLINSSLPHQTVLGFPALKGGFLKKDILKFALKDNWAILSDYHFGGYAKVNKQLIGFINAFKSKSSVSLGPIYTGKMLFGILDRIEQGFFKPGTKILAIHSGGLQGIEGMNLMLKKKNLPLLHI